MKKLDVNALFGNSVNSWITSSTLQTREALYNFAHSTVVPKRFVARKCCPRLCLSGLRVFTGEYDPLAHFSRSW